MQTRDEAKQLDATTMFTYSHANTPLGQSERAYYLSYFINSYVDFVDSNNSVTVLGFCL